MQNKLQYYDNNMLTLALATSDICSVLISAVAWYPAVSMVSLVSTVTSVSLVSLSSPVSIG